MRNTMSAVVLSRGAVIGVGLVIGAVSAWMSFQGNPPNMGVCVACFERDIAGALGLHRASVVQYLRPEIPAIVLGSSTAAIIFGEFRARAGSAPLVRFLLGGFGAIGALVFLGCPWRAIQRLGGGDLNALVGLLGLTAGVAVGSWFLKNGFTLGRARESSKPAGLVWPLSMSGLLILAVIGPTFIFASDKGPGAMHVSILLSVGAGLLIGYLAQRSRFCSVGGIRDALLLRDFHLLSGILAMLVAVVAVNLFLGRFHAGFALQPIAHSDQIWNFLGMVLAGLAFSLLGGCPGRQLILSGEGDTDAATVVVGMIVGAAFAHNFLLAAAADAVVGSAVQVGGPGFNGRVAVGVGIAFCLVIGASMRERFE